MFVKWFFAWGRVAISAPRVFIFLLHFGDLFYAFIAGSKKLLVRHHGVFLSSLGHLQHQRARVAVFVHLADHLLVIIATVEGQKVLVEIVDLVLKGSAAVIVDMGTANAIGEDVEYLYCFGVAMLVTAIKAILYVFFFFIAIDQASKVAKQA